MMMMMMMMMMLTSDDNDDDGDDDRDTCLYFMKSTKPDLVHFYPILSSDVKIPKTKI